MQRLVLAALASFVLTLGIFGVMKMMVAGPDSAEGMQKDRTVIDFVRLKQDSNTELKDRRKPEPPKNQQPSMPKQTASSDGAPTQQQLQFNLPNLNMDTSIAQQSLLGDAVVGMGFGDGDVIPLVRMNAQYPERAVRNKIEGFVTARLVITPEGTVESVEVIDAQPRGVFEREAIRALYRYKFKPKMENGRPVSQVATQTIEFKLGGK